MLYESNYLEHHGIKGQKWGMRRFQNEDGSLTPEGKERYGVDSDSDGSKKQSRPETREERKARYKRGKQFERERRAEESRDYERRLNENDEYQRAENKKNRLDWEAAVDDNRPDLWRDMHRYDAQQKMEDIEYEASEKARQHSRDYIKNKHGDTAVSDMDYYMSQSKKKKAIVAIAALGAIALGSVLHQNNQKKKAEKAYYDDMSNRYKSMFDQINKTNRHVGF